MTAETSLQQPKSSNFLENASKCKLLSAFAHDKLKRSLRSFFTKQVVPGIEDALEGGPTVVIIWTGSPDAGKTFWMTQAGEWLTEKYPRLKEPGGMRILAFENGLQKGREEGVITTAPHQRRKDKEFGAASSFLPEIMREAILQNRVVMAEFATITSVPIDGKLKGLDIGSSTSYPLFLGEEPFGDLNYRPYFIGLVPGDELRRCERWYRKEMKESEGLTARRRIANFFGRKLPETEEEGEEMVKQGASVDTINRLLRQLTDTMAHLKKLKTGIIRPRLSGGSSHREGFPDEEREVFIFKFIKRVVLAGKEKKINNSDIIFVLNDPSIKDLMNLQDVV